MATRAQKKTIAPAGTAKRKRASAAGKAAAAAKKGGPARRSTNNTTKTDNRTATKKVSARTIAKKSRAGDNGSTAAASALVSSQDPIRFPEEGRPLPKTRLSDDDLATFRQLLLDKRAELCGDVERLTDEALHSKSKGQGELSSMPIHMADLGSDNWEQEFTLGLIANEQALVREIDDALRRTKDRTYGICVATHRRISKARLRAKPWAKYCIEYARAREEGRAL